MRTATPTTKRIVFWNAAGSLCTALSSFVYLFIVTRLAGPAVAGDYSIGIAIAQLMWTIGVFEATTYFATDANDHFSFEQYFGFKLITCVTMALTSYVYVMSFGFSAQKTVLALWLCAFKLVDAFGQYYFAAFQKSGRLDVGGFSMTWQVIVAFVAFCAIIAVTKNIVWAIIAATICQLAWILSYNTLRMKQICPIDTPDFNFKAMSRLFIELLPLFLATFLANYLANIPKYAIEAIHADTMQADFSIIFMPSFVINLFLIFVMRPMLTPLATQWAEGKRVSFINVTVKILTAVAGMTLVVIVASYFFGIPVLQAIFKVDLNHALPALLIVMLGGGLSSASNVLYNDIIILRRQRLVLLAYGLSVVSAVITAYPLVRMFQLTGAALAYCISSFVLLLVYALIFTITLHDTKKKV